MNKGLTPEEIQSIDSEIKEAFSDYFEKAGGKNYRYHHFKNVHKLALRLSEEVEEEVDLRVLEASALLHDIGRKADIEEGYMDPFEGHEGHAERGKELVADYLDGILEEQKIGEVRKIIANHHSRVESVEGKILQDADDLAKFGAADIWRMVHYAYEEEMSIGESFKNFENVLKPKLREALDDLNFDFSREMAQNRMQFQEKVIHRMEEEMNAEDY